MRGLVILFAVLLIAASQSYSAEPLPPEAVKVLHRAQECLKRGKAKKGLELLGNFRREHPEIAHHLFLLLEGNLYWEEGKKEEALERWQRATQLSPRDEASWQNLAQALYELQRYAEAADAFLRAYELSKRRELRFYAAVAYLKGKRPREAIPHLEVLARGREVPEEWLLALLQAYLDVGGLEGAEKVLRRLLSRNPEKVDYWKWLAQIYLKQRRYIEAVASLEIASRLRGGKEEKRELAQLYLGLNVPLKAARYYEEIYGSDPDPSACDRIATFYLAAHKIEEALAFIDLAIKKEPTAERFLRKGEILYKERRYEEAYQALKEATSRGGGGYASLLRGYCAWKMGWFQKAREAFLEAASYPGYKKRAQEALRIIAGKEGRSSEGPLKGSDGGRQGGRKASAPGIGKGKEG
ncbi:MAG TPA: tetratricopeptide repeat protein [Deltaproteobacteria bacterium]|nr:tetratricopeptide repeat protein [Deltaproteobacteria bacterium]